MIWKWLKSLFGSVEKEIEVNCRTCRWLNIEGNIEGVSFPMCENPKCYTLEDMRACQRDYKLWRPKC